MKDRKNNQSLLILIPILFLLQFIIVGHAFASHGGYSSSSGMLPPYQSPDPINGIGKKLLAIYMVGSDLESGNGAGTSDLNELITGYNALTYEDKGKIDVVVAFGGANKSGWKGVKFAGLAQIIQDSADGVYGNESSYHYISQGAHMGDESSIKLFLEYLKEGYLNYGQKFLVFWDHGSAYAGFGNDENFNFDSLSLMEIDNALTSSAFGKFDLIGFDACLMGSIEVARFIKNHADYMIASEELEPGHGWNWSAVLWQYVVQDSIIDSAMEIVDNFVQNVHEYESDGKTLSLLDLEKFDNLVTQVDAFTIAFSANMSLDKEYSDAIIYASTNVRDFGKESKEDQRTSVDLKHVAQVIKSKISVQETQPILDNLIAAVDDFVIYAREDGTRPNSNGVSISAPENSQPDMDKYKLNASWLSFQNAFSNLKDSDTTAPIIQEVDYEADSGDFDWDYSDYSDYWGYWYSDNRGVEQKSTNKSNRKSPFLQGERAAFIYHRGTDVDKVARETSGVQGISATFVDNNLAKVTTIFGFELVLNTDMADDAYFMSVAEVEAYPTSTPGQYFTPKWNKKWYCISYDPTAEMTEWMPMIFQGRHSDSGSTYTEYSAEIDYYESGKDYSGNDYPADLATLRIIVDENNNVVNHFVQTYKILFSSSEDTEGMVWIDRSTKKISAGDKIQFWTYGFNLNNPENDNWFETSDIITFTQDPEFKVEELQFENEDGTTLEYKYAMWAEDISGNGIMTTPEAAGDSQSSKTADGDVAPLGNRDGTVNVGDALMALRFALALETPTQEDIEHGDVAPLDAQNKPNPDGVINVGDALIILRKALGLISF